MYTWRQCIAGWSNTEKLQVWFISIMDAMLYLPVCALLIGGNTGPLFLLPLFIGFHLLTHSDIIRINKGIHLNPALRSAAIDFRNDFDSQEQWEEISLRMNWLTMFYIGHAAAFVAMAHYEWWLMVIPMAIMVGIGQHMSSKLRALYNAYCEDEEYHLEEEFSFDLPEDDY